MKIRHTDITGEEPHDIATGIVRECQYTEPNEGMLESLQTQLEQTQAMLGRLVQILHTHKALSKQAILADLLPGYEEIKKG